MKKITLTVIIGLFALCAAGCQNNAKGAALNTYETGSDTDIVSESQSDSQTDAEIEAQRAESLKSNSELFSKITELFPYMTIKGINDKTLSIDMEMLNSKNATEYALATLTETYETDLKNASVESISVFVKSNGTQEGIVMFELNENGFDPIVNGL